MSTSTSTRKSGKDKLYGFLSGYEQCCFTGAAKRDVVRSFRELLDCELKLLNTASKPTSASNIADKLVRFVDSFLTAYYRRMSNCSNSAKVAELADKAKKDSKELSIVLSSIMTGATRQIGSIAICPVKSTEVSDIAIDICEKCPYYLNHKFCILYDYVDFDDDSDIGYHFISFHLPEYRYLALAMVTLASYLVRVDKISVNNLIGYHMLFEYILTVSKIFELMNPSDEVRQSYLDDAEAMLTSDPLDATDPDYQELEKVFYSVCEDIREGKLPYIKDMRNALDKAEHILKSKYDPKLDMYASLKGTAQRDYTGEKMSLLSSCFEVDLNKDLYQEFDDYIGFKSYYPERVHSIQEDIMMSRTILINNPGKFKPRIIHIGDNPTQDRCMYIHRRLQYLLSLLPEDSTVDQEQGRQFLKRLTMEWFLEQDPARKKGIYCFDFSNATDTLDQHFQHLVLEFVMGPEVANFWDQVSNSDKYIQEIGGGYHRYQQRCGQPQGLLGSFDAFALAHHFIFLMDMKILALTDKSARDFYKILGDDSVCSSIEPEIDTFTRGEWLDKEGLPRSLTEQVHFRICEKFAGFKVNYDKSDSTHYDSDEAKLDFAKVTYRNGVLFTPIPFRLAMNFYASNDAKLAVAIWRGERQDPLAKSYMDIISENISEEEKLIIKSGIIPFLDPFKDESIIYNDSWLGRLRYAVAISHLNMALSFSIINDKERDQASFDLCETALKRLLGYRVANRLDQIDPNHKVMILWEENERIMSLLHDIYEADDLESKFLTLACSTLGEEFLQGDFFDGLLELGTTRRMLLYAKSNPDADVSTVFPDFNMGLDKRLRMLSQKCMTRGIAKRPREEVSLFNSIVNLLREVESVLGTCSITMK